MRLTVYFPENSPTTHEFVGSRLTVGRLGDNDVALDEGSVSSRHAEIVVADDAAVLRDLGSTNGTFVNGERVTGESPLSEGDEVYFGNVRSVFMEPVASPEIPEVEPAVEAPPAQVGSGAPDNFRPLSPLPRPVAPKDTLGMAAWGIAAVAVIAAAYAFVSVLGA
ncbi:MAG: FHA domain-containing protein [Chthoniobacterales bacterium]|nr:FHA domain-containing protein [Chthoniobacterales bacterium]